MMNENLTTLIKYIKEIRNDRRYIIGIDGLSRSGKTTIVREFSNYLVENSISSQVFHIDDYIVEREKRYNTGNEEWFEYYNLQWDVEWLHENFFKKLKEADELKLPLYDNVLDRHIDQKIKLPKTGIIIIEGVFLQRSEWRNFYDFMVYLDCPRNKRFLRENKETQKNIKKFENRYWKAEEFYSKIENPIKNANLVLKS